MGRRDRQVQGLCMLLPGVTPAFSLLSPPGEAPPTPVPVPNVGKEASKLPGLWVVIIVLVATALLALNVSAIVCIVRRRRNKRASPPTKKTPPPSISASAMPKAMPISPGQGKSPTTLCCILFNSTTGETSSLVFLQASQS